MQTRVVVKDEVFNPNPGGWVLAFQKVIYMYGDGETENGFRFIWYRPDGSLQPARGQARIPSITDLKELVTMAEERGWH